MDEPTPRDLALIDAEWPVIAAELRVVTTECRLAVRPCRTTARAYHRALAALAALRPTPSVA